MATRKKGRRSQYTRNWGKYGSKTRQQKKSSFERKPFEDKNWTEEQFKIMSRMIAMLCNIKRTKPWVPDEAALQVMFLPGEDYTNVVGPNTDLSKLVKNLELVAKLAEDTSPDLASSNLLVNAGPGCAKTTTIAGGLWYAYLMGLSPRIGCGVFSNTAKNSLLPKVPPNVDVRTVHSLGREITFDHWKDRFKQLNVGKNEVFKKLAEIKLGTEEEMYTDRRTFIDTIKLAMTEVCRNETEVIELMVEFGLNPQLISMHDFARNILSAMNDTLKNPVNIDGKPLITFPFMVYGPIMNGWKPKSNRTYDLMITDECQDISNALRENLELWSNRFIFIGDRYQAIFRFAGADSDSIDKLESHFKCNSLPLMQTFRCPKLIVERCNAVNPDLAAAESNIDGSIEEIELPEIWAHLQPGDVVLSRTKAPLVTGCFAGIRRGLNCNIINNDIGDMLILLMKQLKADTPAELIFKTQQWRDDTVEEYEKNGWKTEGVWERAECLIALVQGVMMQNHNATIADIVANIDRRFGQEPDAAAIMWGTIHRSKGLEWNRVFILNSTYLNHGKMSEKDHETERLIRYVGESRVQNTLYLVEGKDFNEIDKPEMDDDY